LTIAGLTQNSVIKILDELGRIRVTLKERDDNGGYDWDTRDASGRLLPSGVYICYVTDGSKKLWAKFVIVR